jgi:hypothetical protein
VEEVAADMVKIARDVEVEVQPEEMTKFLCDFMIKI